MSKSTKTTTRGGTATVTKPLRNQSAAKSQSDAAQSSRFDRLNLRKKSKPGQKKNASFMGGAKDVGRFRFIWGVMVVAFAVLFIRVAWLQVLNSSFYIQKGDELITSASPTPAYRGVITDRTGAPLAANAPLFTVIFDPRAYAEEYYRLRQVMVTSSSNNARKAASDRLNEMDLMKLATAASFPLEKLKEVTQLDDTIDFGDSQQIKKVLPSGPGNRRLVLLSRVSPEVASTVTQIGFFGVASERSFQRYYLQAEPNAQIIGYMGRSNSDDGYAGRAGVESKYDEILAGQDGAVRVMRGTRNRPIQEIDEITPLVDGQDLNLTIDSRLQYVLYKELEQVGRLQSARSSSGMVVDVQTGEVLAMASWPSFNSNNLSERDGANERNRPVQDLFEPGSVMKPFTVAAALDSGKYNTRSLIDTNPGSVAVGGYTIRDGSNYGVITLAKLIQKSSNVASTKIALNLPADGVANIQRKFGFGAKTALDMPGEVAGRVDVPKAREHARRATLSYGYGQEVTLAQIAQAYAALGNKGMMQPLTLVKEAKKQQPVQVIGSEHAQEIVRMMELVTQAGGTGQRAALNGYRVAGKTGTSRRTNPAGGYYSDQFRTIFAGVAPASNPRFATVILVEDPREQFYAGQVSAPVFHSVMKEALRLYNVPYDKPLYAEALPTPPKKPTENKPQTADSRGQ